MLNRPRHHSMLATSMLALAALASYPRTPEKLVEELAPLPPNRKDPEYVPTDEDLARMEAAKAKRQRKLTRKNKSA